MTDYIETYRKIPVDKIVEFDETPGFGPWKDLFSSESTKHPAKANLNMLRFLVERFTKPGDVILDPMGGTGSTGTMANILGRNAILVEYEEKFADMCKDNMEIVKKKPGLHKGSTLVIQGDARELSSILKEKVDFAMFSPPYLDARNGAKRTISSVAKDQKLGASQRELQKSWGSDGTNIGDLPMGDVDTVLTSPPYAHPSTAAGATPLEKEGKFKMGHSKEKAYDDTDWRFKKHRGGNIGKMGLFKKVPCSPEEADHHDTRPGRKGTEWEYTKTVKVEVEDVVDTVLTSPPHGNVAHKPGNIEQMREKLEELYPGHVGEHTVMNATEYSDDEENLGNLPYGKVDQVITSPPYEGTRPWKAKDYEKFSEGMEERTRDGRMKRNFATAEAQQRYVDKMQEGARMTEGNIGQERGKTYLEAMLQVYSESYAVLKPGGLMIIIVKNFVRDWKPIRLDTDTIKLCEHIGFDLVEHLYRRLKQKSFWIRNYETKFRKKFPDPETPLPTAQFEDILIFQKPTAL